jgi:hypothetical protein
VLVQAAVDALPEDVKDFSDEGRGDFVQAMRTVEVLEAVGLHSLTVALIPKLVAVCERFLLIPAQTAHRGPDPQAVIRFLVPVMHSCLGDAQQNLGNPAAAEAAYEMAIVGYRRLLDSYDPEARWLV